jgi:hypothetical protein
VFDDDVSLVGRRLESPETCGFLGSVIHDMLLLENTATLSARAPRGFVPASASVAPRDAPMPRGCTEQRAEVSTTVEFALEHSTPIEQRQTYAFDLADDVHGLAADAVFTVTAPVDDIATSPATSVEDFISSISANIVTPIISSRPKLRVSKEPDYSIVPRRSVRLADKPKASNPEVQATRVLLHKLGKDDPPPSSDESGTRRFKETFGGNLSSSKKQAMRELFSARKRFGSRRSAA